MEKGKALGVILCGGESSRMGMDKSLINYHGVSQREHLFKMLSPLCSPVVFSIGEKREDLESAFSDLEEYASNGPISGLLSIHNYFPERDIVLVGCDYPLILPKHLLALIEEYREEYDAVCYTSGTSLSPEPLLTYYSAGFCARIRRSFEETGQSSLKKYLEQGNSIQLDINNPIHLISADRSEDVNRVRQIIQDGFDTFES